jgi:hypothetical protein
MRQRKDRQTDRKPDIQTVRDSQTIGQTDIDKQKDGRKDRQINKMIERQNDR